MAESAAFFDLDRTLLKGASGPVITEALQRVGVISERNVPGQDLLFKLFDLIGENRPSMMLTRQMARFSEGWVRARVQEAGEIAGDILVESVAPFAKPLIDEHKEAGRPLVMATTSPYDLVKPLAERLGFTDVIATRYGEAADGTYDGSILGPFVWGPGKLEAVQAWANEHGIDVAESYAYSDSFYDAPLLGAVKFPMVVNPDPRMRFLAVLRRWPVRYLDVPSGVPKLFGVEPQQVIQAFSRPELVPYARFQISGTDNIPTEGGAIVVANHRSYFDPAAVNMVLAQVPRPGRFLGKKEVFDAPVVGQLASALGGIRVDRGTGSDEPLRAAAEAIEAGEIVTVMPQGTIPRGPAFFDPELKGRWGAAKLAAMTKAPVIPVGLWGTEEIWPRSARLPNLLNITDPPLVTATVGPPVELKYRSADADTKRIMAAITDLLPPEAREPYEPTEEELRRTFPPGYDGDPTKEDDRRPGADT